MTEEILEQVFEVQEPASLYLNNIRGSIEIHPQDPAAESKVITVKAVKDLDSGDGDLTTVEMTQESDGKVVVKTRFAGLDVSSFEQLKRRPCKIHFSVEVPKNCKATLEAVSSSIALDGLQGAFDLNSISGGIDLQDLDGELRAHSVSGQIRAEALKGKLDFESVSGDIDLSKSQVPALKAKTVSGKILVQAAGQTDAYDFHTISGDVTLILAEEQGVSVQMQSLSGKLNLHHADGIARQRAPKDLAVQGGGPKVRFETISGDLHLTTQDVYKAEATDQDAPSVSQHDVLQHDVLASVARGELSAEEGLQALKGSGAG